MTIRNHHSTHILAQITAGLIQYGNFGRNLVMARIVFSARCQ